MAKSRSSSIVAKDAADATRRVAERWVELAAAPGLSRFTVALSGGSTPKLLYETLAAAPVRDRMPWNRVELFFALALEDIRYEQITGNRAEELEVTVNFASGRMTVVARRGGATLSDIAYADSHPFTRRDWL